ncbi:MAG TPA: hypothetical protein VE977_13970, partial [Pyrinomonadaceae bacterium]|nr:hypothetical protein [Pyrinomonadaceae bacterium]
VRQQSTRACQFLQYSFSSPFPMVGKALLAYPFYGKGTDTNVCPYPNFTSRPQGKVRAGSGPKWVE